MQHLRQEKNLLVARLERHGAASAEGAFEMAVNELIYLVSSSPVFPAGWLGIPPLARWVGRSAAKLTEHCRFRPHRCALARAPSQPAGNDNEFAEKRKVVFRRQPRRAGRQAGRQAVSSSLAERTDGRTNRRTNERMDSGEASLTR